MRALILAALALVLIAPPASAGCDWQAIEHASIQIDVIPGGYRAVFMSGENCTFSGEGPELLATLDNLLASMWCDWAASEA